jgi:hypothetical protein
MSALGHAPAAAGNRGPKVIQHVTMETKALARGKADDPYAGALIFRQQRGANAWVRILALALELGLSTMLRAMGIPPKLLAVLFRITD